MSSSTPTVQPIAKNQEEDTTKGLARLQTAGILRTDKTITKGIVANPTPTPTFQQQKPPSNSFIQKLKPAANSMDKSDAAVASNQNRIEDLYQHYMKNSMRKYVPPQKKSTVTFEQIQANHHQNTSIANNSICDHTFA